ncbi:hypothetical protein [Halomonas elongata]|uniref:hypothetical protein n=1 Tax=Halomonas elongata TaxID=2746 RepID=UPI00186BA427|nr:hypothetical protein [Halomonas elongata]MBW5802020.1 hypothetical protein [Halomonas elongata]
MTMTPTPIGRDRDHLIDETNRLQRKRLELAVTGPVLARLRCDLRYHQAMTQLMAQTEAWDDDAQVRINGRQLMHQFFADHYQHELEQLEGKSFNPDGMEPEASPRPGAPSPSASQQCKRGVGASNG